MWSVITLLWSELLILPILWFYLITRNLDITLLLVACLVVWEIFWTLTKILFFKDRPDPMQYKNIIWKVLASSFPSIHTLRTCIIFLFSLKYSLVFSPIFFIIYILVATSRIKVRKHFFIDTVWGTIYAIWVFVLFFVLIWMFNCC